MNDHEEEETETAKVRFSNMCTTELLDMHSFEYMDKGELVALCYILVSRHESTLSSVQYAIESFECNLQELRDI